MPTVSFSQFPMYYNVMCSAKQLVKGEPNVSYICSRYYRAPELIFGATDYTTQIGLTQLTCLDHHYTSKDADLVQTWCNGTIFCGYLPIIYTALHNANLDLLPFELKIGTPVAPSLQNGMFVQILFYLLFSS